MGTISESFPIVPVLARRLSRRVAIKVKGTILFIDPTVVIAFRAEGNYVLLEKESTSYHLRESISVLSEKLEAYGFVRIHRSVLVNASFVEEIRPLSTGAYCVRVKGGKEYVATRTYKMNLKCLAESWIGTGAFFSD
jgi:DNA-binding LytR/AlgR family response regulator